MAQNPDSKARIYTVWVGGVEVTDHLVTKFRAETLAEAYCRKDYDDVCVEQY